MSSCRRKTRRPSVKISSSTRTGCTTDRGPKYRASAWNPNVPARKKAPRSHTGWRTRSIAVRHSGRAPAGRLVAASRCRTALHAFDSADRMANTIAAAIAGPLALPGDAWAGMDCGCGVSFSFHDSHGSESLKACVQSRNCGYPAASLCRCRSPPWRPAAAARGRPAGPGSPEPGLEPAGQAGETLVRQDVRRIVGVVAGLRAAEQGRNGLLLAVVLVGGRFVTGVVAEGDVDLGVVQGQGGGAQTALGEPGYRIDPGAVLALKLFRMNCGTVWVR